MANVELNYAQCENLVSKLKEKDLIEERELIACPDRKVHFNNVLDYEKCNKEKWLKQRDDFYKEDIEKGLDNKDPLWKERIEQAKYYPINIVNDDTISWASKWRSNEDPFIYISLALPDEIIAYEATYLGRFSCGTLYKNGDHVAKDGSKVFTTISNVKEHLIKDVGNGSYQVSLPYADPDSDETRFVRIYVKESQIGVSKSYVHLENDNLDERYKRIDITTKDVVMYETDRSSGVSKQKIDARQFFDGVERARSIYEEKQRARNENYISSQTENHEIAEDEENEIPF